MGSKARRKQQTRSRPARPPGTAVREAALIRPTMPGRDPAPAQPAAPARVTAAVPRTPDPARAGPSGCRSDFEREAAGQVLTATCWLEPEDSGPAGPVTVRFTGRRTGITGAPGRGDRFEREETVEGVLPGSGPVSVTTRTSDVTAGEWLVRARVVARPGPRGR
jgi:hypothetical protein